MVQHPQAFKEDDQIGTCVRSARLVNGSREGRARDGTPPTIAYHLQACSDELCLRYGERHGGRWWRGRLGAGRGSAGGMLYFCAHDINQRVPAQKEALRCRYLPSRIPRTARAAARSRDTRKSGVAGDAWDLCVCADVASRRGESAEEYLCANSCFNVERRISGGSGGRGMKVVRGLASGSDWCVRAGGLIASGGGHGYSMGRMRRLGVHGNFYSSAWLSWRSRQASAWVSRQLDSGGRSACWKGATIAICAASRVESLACTR